MNEISFILLLPNISLFSLNSDLFILKVVFNPSIENLVLGQPNITLIESIFREKLNSSLENSKPISLI